MNNEINNDRFVKRLRQMELEYSQGKRWTRSELIELYPFYGGKAAKFNPSLSLEKRIAKLEFEASAAQERLEARKNKTYTFGRTDLSEQVNRPMWMDSIMSSPIYTYSEKWVPEQIQKHQTQFAEKVEEALDTDELLNLAVDIAEVTNIDPYLGDVLPATNVDQTLRTEKLKGSQRQGQIEIWSENGYMSTIYGTDMNPEPEIMEPIPNDEVEEYLREHTSYKNINLHSNFKVEEVKQFPINGDCFPHIVEKIESYLECQDIWRFRLAFDNVTKSAKKERSRTFIKEITQDCHLQTSITRKTCICNTQLYDNPWKLQHYGPIARRLFNYRIRFSRVKGYSYKIICQQKPSSHAKQHQACDNLLTVRAYQQNKKVYYEKNNLKIYTIPQIRYNKVRMKFGLERHWKENFLLNDPYWNEIT